jgi:hypothetical protein
LEGLVGASRFELETSCAQVQFAVRDESTPGVLKPLIDNGISTPEQTPKHHALRPLTLRRELFSRWVEKAE